MEDIILSNIKKGIYKNRIKEDIINFEKYINIDKDDDVYHNTINMAHFLYYYNLSSIIDSDNSTRTQRDEFLLMVEHFYDNDTHFLDIRNFFNIITKYVKLDVLDLTPLNRVEEQLDLIENNFFKNKDAKVLDPCCGFGNYQVILIEKFMIGLKDIIPSSKDRYKHIIENIIYSCDISEEYLFSYNLLLNPRNEFKLNLYCGDFLNDGFDKEMIKKIWGFEKFDLICGHLEHNKKNSIRPLYNHIVEKCYEQKLGDKMLFLTPGKWVRTGYDFIKLRKTLFSSKSVKYVKNIIDLKSYFHQKNQTILNGGLSYLYIDLNYNDNRILFNNEIVEIDDKYDILIDPKSKKIMDRFLNMTNISGKLKAETYFNIDKNLKNLKTVPSTNTVKIKMSKRGMDKWINKNFIKDKDGILNQYKVLIPQSTAGGNKIGSFGRMRIVGPNTIHTKTFVSIAIDNIHEAGNLSIYLNTIFAQFFLYLRKPTKKLNKQSLKWIPNVDLKEEWNDKKLCEKYNITDHEFEHMKEKVKLLY